MNMINLRYKFEYLFTIYANDFGWQGFVEKEKLDSFNIPVYGPSLAELQSIVETEQSFEIENMRLLSGFPSYPSMEMEVREGEEEMFGRIVSNFYRALFENLVAILLGSDDHMVNEIFTRIAKRAAANYGEFFTDMIYMVVAILIRKRQ